MLYMGKTKRHLALIFSAVILSGCLRLEHGKVALTCDIPPPRITLGETPDISPRYLDDMVLVPEETWQTITDKGAEPLNSFAYEDGDGVVALPMEDWRAMLDADGRLAFAFAQQRDWIVNMAQCQRRIREEAAK